MSIHTSPEEYAEAAKRAEALSLWNVAEANWRMAAERLSSSRINPEEGYKEKTNVR